MKEVNTLPLPNVLTRKHVFDDGYAILTAMQVRDRFEGNLACTTLAVNSPVFEHGETMEECCDKLDQRFREIMPDHQCGSGCLRNWQSGNAIFEEPTGKPQ
ncbi:MAG: hypothetical protein ABSG02_21120 [Terriglobales bacterium]|jgi:hypothetical protein